jgi:hypothetical protein
MPEIEQPPFIPLGEMKDDHTGLGQDCSPVLGGAPVEGPISQQALRHDGPQFQERGGVHGLYTHAAPPSTTDAHNSLNLSELIHNVEFRALDEGRRDGIPVASVGSTARVLDCFDPWWHAPGEHPIPPFVAIDEGVSANLLHRFDRFMILGRMALS